MKPFFFLLFCSVFTCFSQSFPGGYWQQEVNYKMVIDVNTENHTYQGKQILEYKNNSPDTLNRVFYHLFFNAFRPNSEQVLASKYATFERRGVAEKIANLKSEDWGLVEINKLLQDGNPVTFNVEETILEVMLNTPLLPNSSTTFEMDFFTQTPLVMQRSGKKNKDGVEFSMSQWYPKLCEYDFEGWHANPYIGREFHGVWGDFDVTINIDSDYVVAASGDLQNPELIGHGYADLKKGIKHGDRLSWNFIANNVHDFSWAADPDYIHDKLKMKDGPTLHFFYEKSSPYVQFWKDFQKPSAEMMRFFSENIGPYPYNQYSIIMAGDGGMEYAMCTFIAGYEYSDFRRLLSVTSHEIAHTWFQFLMATNESKHAWMDEGFTSYIDDVCLNEILDEGKDLPNSLAYEDYLWWATTGNEEPLTTHADRYEFGEGYWISAYDKGSIFMSQLKYIVGDDNFEKILKRYYNDWAFKHPTPNDFIRVAEKVSNINLDWYLMDWTQTVKTIDYKILSVDDNDSSKSNITLQRVGQMPMPCELIVFKNDGTSFKYYIPLRMMRGNKTTDDMKLLDDWAWANPYYSFTIDIPFSDIAELQLNPDGIVADINPKNDLFRLSRDYKK